MSDSPFSVGKADDDSPQPLRIDGDGVLRFRRLPHVVPLYPVGAAVGGSAGPAASLTTINRTFDPATINPDERGRIRLTLRIHTDGTPMDGRVLVRLRDGDHQSTDFEQVSQFAEYAIEGEAVTGQAFVKISAKEDPTNEGKKDQFTYHYQPDLDGFDKLSVQILGDPDDPPTAGSLWIEAVLD